MRAFRDMPIKRKLMVIILVTTTAALLLSGLGIVVSDSILFRGYLQRDLTALARIIADNSTASVAFDDPRSAGEMLAALKARIHLVTACVIRQDGSMLARYARQDSPSGCPSAQALDQIRSTPAGLAVSRAVVLNGRRIGTFVLLYDLGELSERFRLYGTTVLCVLLASSVIAFLLSSRLRSVIATPISQLAQVTASVSETQDYSIRARKLSADELGVLVDGFNEMLARIQSRDHDLRKALLAREDALRDAQSARDSLKTTLASIGDAVISTDAAGCVAFANRIAQGLLKWSEPDITRMHLDEVFGILNEFTREKTESPVSRVLREGGIVGSANDAVLVVKDGTEIPIDHTAAPILGEGGTTQGVVLVFRDATARRRAEETSRLLASIVESSDDAIIGQDLNGIVTSWNKGAERILGFSAEEMIGRPVALISAPNRLDEMPRILERIKNGERIDQYQAVRITKSGKLIHVSITVSPLHDALGRISGASMIARDITGQVRAADRLAQLNADLQKSNVNLARSNEDLERFAFVASHDLQEPLRMITVYSQLLVRSYPRDFDGQALMFVENIVGGTKRMRELLSDLLAYTEIGAPSEEAAEPVDLNAVMVAVEQNLAASIEEAGAVVTSDRLPTVNAYRGHLIPLFQNLVGNGIKYRREETPRIHVSAVRTDSQLLFSVADNGMGIEPQYHLKIFGAFKRLHGKNIPGTGIGLAICQRVVERYGGRIWVESEAGRGAKFLFTLPGAGDDAVNG